jgi:hypothetical protein
MWMTWDAGLFELHTLKLLKTPLLHFCNIESP